MTTERKTGQARDVGDARVSAAYRDLAGERTPASLNERVLREARANAGRGYSYWMAWLRPAAWVTTVGLCLAVVIELSSVAPVTTDRADLPASPATAGSARERADDRDTGRAPPVDESRRQEPAPKRADEEAAQAKSAAPPARPRAESPGPAVGSSERDAVPSSDLFQITDAPIVEEAEEMARMREGPGPDPAGNRASRSVAAHANAAAAGRPGECDDEARTEVESWVNCILEIERRGGNAEQERQALRAEYPDADLP